jgi:DNA-binding response OmpR family regulator
MKKEFQLDPGAVILVVDDEELCRRNICHMLSDDNVVVLEAGCIEDAWKIATENSAVRIDAILLDRKLPDGDGLELLQRLRSISELKLIPAIIQSGMTDQADISRGMLAGAYHYLEKPYRRQTLRMLIHIATREGRERRFLVSKIAKTDDFLTLMKASEFEIRTFSDVDRITPYLAQMFPTPECAAIGISELLVNAIEHGNLEIGYQKKSELLDTNTWSSEVARRQADPRYNQRKVTIHLRQLPDRTELTISDEGSGFDWKKYEEISKDRIFDLHGRGIPLARNLCFDQCQYHDKGNSVTCVGIHS